MASWSTGVFLLGTVVHILRKIENLLVWWELCGMGVVSRVVSATNNSATEKLSFRSIMKSFEIRSLNDLQIANPCPADWNEMTGDEQVRHCKLCEKNVYNLSNIPEQDALNIIKEHNGNLCGRLYLRKDGTVIVNDCPVGFGQVATNGGRLLVTVGAVVILFFGSWVALASTSSGGSVSHRWEDFVSSLRSWFGLPPTSCITGMMKCPAPPPITIAPAPPPPLPQKKTSGEM